MPPPIVASAQLMCTFGAAPSVFVPTPSPKPVLIEGKPAGTIMDTLWTGLDQKNVLWMRFLQWTGKTVFHCHILPHEDTGMMANLLIEP